MERKKKIVEKGLCILSSSFHVVLADDFTLLGRAQHTSTRRNGNNMGEPYNIELTTLCRVGACSQTNRISRRVVDVPVCSIPINKVHTAPLYAPAGPPDSFLDWPAEYHKRYRAKERWFVCFYRIPTTQHNVQFPMPSLTCWTTRKKSAGQEAKNLSFLTQSSFLLMPHDREATINTWDTT